MDYQNIHNQLIEKRKANPANGYTETHHIIPRSLGGIDGHDNLVVLTAREHFLAHLLLVKIHENTQNFYKMVKAFHMMLVCSSDNQQRHITSRKFEELRKLFSVAKSAEQTGSGNSQYGTVWIIHEMFGKKRINGNLLPDYIEQGWFRGRTFRFCKTKKVREKDPKMVEQFTDWYNIYKKVGFSEFCKITGYDKSKPNLVQNFGRYVQDFKPQNGKRRGR